jgi:hypothetical protein
LTFQLSSFKGFFFPTSPFVALGVVGVALGDRGDDDVDVDVDVDAPLFPLKKTKTPLLLFRPASQNAEKAIARIIITIVPSSSSSSSSSENHAFCARDTCVKYLDLFFYLWGNVIPGNDRVVKTLPFVFPE